MTSKFCSNCGAQQVAGAAFCPSCGAPAAAAPPAQPSAPPQPAAYAPPPHMPPGAVPEQPPYAGATPLPGHAGIARPGGMSRGTMIGIGIAVVVAVAIAIFVQRSEREFQNARRAAQAPAGATASPPPAQQGGTPPGAPYGGYYSGGTPGTEGWERNQLVGRWSSRGCSAATFEFRADGSTFAASGGESMSGRWTLQNSRLTVVEPAGTTILQIVEMGDEMVTEAQGRRQTWRRC